MKKRRPSSENPFYSRGYKSESLTGTEVELPVVSTPVRRCRKEKCKQILPPEKYFYCKKCEKTLPLDNGMDSLLYKR